MRKSYEIPTLELLYFYADADIASSTAGFEDETADSWPWNDGELGGWT